MCGGSGTTTGACNPNNSNWRKLTSYEKAWLILALTLGISAIIFIFIMLLTWTSKEYLETIAWGTVMIPSDVSAPNNPYNIYLGLRYFSVDSEGGDLGTQYSYESEYCDKLVEDIPGLSDELCHSCQLAGYGTMGFLISAMCVLITTVILNGMRLIDGLNTWVLWVVTVACSWVTFVFTLTGVLYFTEECFRKNSDWGDNWDWYIAFHLAIVTLVIELIMTLIHTFVWMTKAQTVVVVQQQPVQQQQQQLVLSAPLPAAQEMLYAPVNPPMPMNQYADTWNVNAFPPMMMGAQPRMATMAPSMMAPPQPPVRYMNQQPPQVQVFYGSQPSQPMQPMQGYAQDGDWQEWDDEVEFDGQARRLNSGFVDEY